MQVTPEQLHPGCVLTADVIGKSNKPLMKQNTVLNVEHITVLKKFMISSVNISPKLINGKPFLPNVVEVDIAKGQEKEGLFIDHYLRVVVQYKELFAGWKDVTSIDINVVREIFIPLLKRVNKAGKIVLTLNKYAKKEDYLYHHSVAVGLISAFLAKQMGYKKSDIMQIGLAGLLSDCGMSWVSRSIKVKDTPLTEKEYAMIKYHPTYSYNLVKNITILSKGTKIAMLQHHERNDGSGYPLGVTRHKIHPFAQVIAVGDVYHAMVCDRVYRKKQSPFRVLEEIYHEQFSGLEPKVVQTLVAQMAAFTTGERVQLSNDTTGRIVFVEKGYPTRPMIRLDTEGTILSLKDYPSIYIKEIL